jgi:hypothetical protein
MVRALELFRAAAAEMEQERVAIAREIWKILVEEDWIIGTGGSPLRWCKCGSRS